MNYAFGTVKKPFYAWKYKCEIGFEKEKTFIFFWQTKITWNKKKEKKNLIFFLSISRNKQINTHTHKLIE